MSLSPEVKKRVIESFGINANDTGSTFVQVALLSERIRTLTEHLKVNKKDFSTKQRGLLVLIAQRKSFLNYLAKKDEQGYKELVKRLGLKK
ncbi:30S ribosomal protein S15 [Candidatus Dependentiae bacterium]|jgi:small subunit ribosomal protein S15|nr:30S ribosomal protein S15 [Candidatus Dependentiae bacterium]MCC7414495.1 30S ribosomal protein S15 [Campylobacterota bacterium]